MSLDPHAMRLECGADAATLVQQVVDGRVAPTGSHQESCELCQATLTELARRWRVADRWLREPVRAPRSLVESVMSRIGGSGPSDRHRVATTPRGATTITTRALVVVVAVAALEVPGVRRLAGRFPSTIRSRDQAGTITVALELVAQPHADLRRAASDVRRRVVADCAWLLGLELAAVDVAFVDLEE